MGDKKDQKKITNEKPVKIPLSFKEALKGLLSTKPPKEDKEKTSK